MLATPVPSSSPIVPLWSPEARGLVCASDGISEVECPVVVPSKHAGEEVGPPRRPQLWPAIRLVESAFPRDGFAEAAGLDEAHRGGRVRDGDALSLFVEDALWEVGAFNLPFVRATRGDAALLAATDGVCDALMPNPLARRASRAGGQVFLSGAASLSPAASRLTAGAGREGLPGHLAPAFGAVLGLLGAGEDDACRLFLYLGARGIFSAAVRLGVVAPPESYARLAAVAPTVNAVVLEHPDDDRADVTAMALSPALAAGAGAAPAAPTPGDGAP